KCPATPARHPPGADPVDPSEIRRFAALAEEWWAPAGKFRPLHALNPVRLGFIRGQALAAFGRDPRQRAPPTGLDAAEPRESGRGSRGLRCWIPAAGGVCYRSRCAGSEQPWLA